MKKLSSILAVVLVLAMVLAMAPAVFAAECPLVDGAGYKIVANNKNGPMYFKGTISSGRWDCSANEAEAVAVYVEAVTGGWKMYIKDGTAKKYLVMNDESQGAAFADSADTASVFVWDSNLNTLVESDPDNARAFGCDPSKTYLNYSCYAVSNGTKYNWGQFVAFAAVEDTREALPTAAADIVDAIYKLKAGESLSTYYKYDTFTLTGTIVGAVSWADDYNNGELTIKVAGSDKELKAFRFKAGDISVDTIKALVAGDKVTFEVESAKNYNGTFELEYPVLKATEKATNNDNNNNNNDTNKDPDNTGDNTAIVAMTTVMVMSVAALAVLVIGKKRMF